MAWDGHGDYAFEPAFEPADVLILSGGTARSFSAVALHHQREFAQRMGYRFAVPAPSAGSRPRHRLQPRSGLAGRRHSELFLGRSRNPSFVQTPYDSTPSRGFN